MLVSYKKIKYTYTLCKDGKLNLVEYHCFGWILWFNGKKKKKKKNHQQQQQQQQNMK